jgi:hypothetical protein
MVCPWATAEVDITRKVRASRPVSVNILILDLVAAWTGFRVVPDSEAATAVDSTPAVDLTPAPARSDQAVQVGVCRLTAVARLAEMVDLEEPGLEAMVAMAVMAAMAVGPKNKFATKL